MWGGGCKGGGGGEGEGGGGGGGGVGGLIRGRASQATALAFQATGFFHIYCMRL